jgi:adenylate cyclase
VTTEQRRLAAIVSADIAGYSRLMGRDESGTLAALKAIRLELVDPAIASHGGRIVKTMGDGLLLEFPSVVNAVRCALVMQTAMADRTAEVPDDRRIAFRIGINQGDIIIEGDDIFGDGVNVAARLQEIAAPGGICVSSRVHEDVRDRLDATFDDGGTQTLKNIARPVQVWHWRPDAAAAKLAPEPIALPLPDKPSIAVLPFQNMSGDPEHEYFADGMVEDIITALSRIPSLFVIARSSSFAYKNKAVDVRQVGRELGVRYLMEGSVRKAGNRLRITGQLIEAESGAHIWADKFDSLLDDVFDLQDRVTTAVTGVIEPSITQAEIRRASRKPTENLLAYDWLLRALGEEQLWDRESNRRIIELARHAVTLDPHFALAYAYLAKWIQRRKLYGWMSDEAAETAEGIHFAYHAVRLEPQDPRVLTEAAFALGHLNYDIATAIPLLDRAIALNPNSAGAYGWGAIVRDMAGDYVLAAEHVDRAIRLSPFDSGMFAFAGARGYSHLFRRQLPEAIQWLRKSTQMNANHSPTFLALGSALAHAGQMEDARAAIRRLLKLRPMSSVAWQRQRRFFLEGDFEYLVEGAQLAGLPE